MAKIRMLPVPRSIGRVADLPRNVSMSTVVGVSVTLALNHSTSIDVTAVALSSLSVNLVLYRLHLMANLFNRVSAQC